MQTASLLRRANKCEETVVGEKVLLQSTLRPGIMTIL